MAAARGWDTGGRVGVVFRVARRGVLAVHESNCAFISISDLGEKKFLLLGTGIPIQPSMSTYPKLTSQRVPSRGILEKERKELHSKTGLSTASHHQNTLRGLNGFTRES